MALSYKEFVCSTTPTKKRQQFDLGQESFYELIHLLDLDVFTY